MEENNNADVNFRLGWCYAKNQNYLDAYKYYLKAANLGNASAMHNISLLFFNGQGVSQNYAKGREWLEKAVNNGNEYSRYCMGSHIFYGHFGYSKNLYEAKQIIEQAAYNGNSDAMYFLGFREEHVFFKKKQPQLLCEERDYFQGTLEGAEKWYRMAANAGNAEAMYQLANLGDEKDTYSIAYVLSDDERFEWFKKSAELGYVRSIRPLYWLLCKKKNFSESLKWLIKLYKKTSDTDSYYSEYFSESGGVKKDLNEIYEGDPDLLDDIKKVFPWFYPGIQ